MNYKTLAKRQDTEFTKRHIGLSDADIDKMLGVCGLKNLDDLVAKTVPDTILSLKKLALPTAMTEAALSEHMRTLARSNNYAQDMIGQGYYGTITPNVILRNVLENPGWYTAYTPYQPEISQGRLEAILNFQTMVADLCGLEIANASLLDEATAAAEAMTLARRQSKSKSNVFFIDDLVHPQTIDILVGRAEPMGIKIVIDKRDNATADYFGALFQYPATDGSVIDLSDIIAPLKHKQTIIALATDLMALTLLKSPAEMGADIALGSSQRFGVPLGYGGPHAAFFATHDAFKRVMPGRLVGVSKDSHGNMAYRLTLQTREQHIKRERATSNICTAQVLLAVMAGMYGVYHGPEGVKSIASRIHLLSRIFVQGISDAGFKIININFFDTIVIETGDKTTAIHEQSFQNSINLRHYDDTHIAVSFDETCDEKRVQTLWDIFNVTADFDSLSQNVTINNALPKRDTDFMTHPVFSHYHSETDMMRYLRKLMDKDLALDRAMIPLGSCTMKLNAVSEMLPVSLPGFANIHPFRPFNQVSGYLTMIEELEDYLANITGFDAVSLQPNSGAAGEYAGLMAIRGLHHRNNEKNRTICLIPTSAHGTNPASAIMAGMKVVAINCDTDGNIDVADLTEKAQKHQNELAALMITYPSTHGVFETQIQEICRIIHQFGGRVYMDGANMNAQVGLTSPGLIGADVCHLNLHKTFCIPHGGGGPGVGPIGVTAELAPFLPGHKALKNAPTRHQRGFTPVSAAPFGSAGILAIPYAYIRMTSHNGLVKSTQAAILSANYIAKRLEAHYPILYKGHYGFVAHECILDTRTIKETVGVTVDDIAKRLADYGFHSPTMSWPVIGTLMVEPTESEPLSELDRFCDAMIAIRGEINAITKGVYEYAQSPLANAPHTAFAVTDENWDKPYSRQVAAFPTGLNPTKFWPTVGRVDNVFGDRNVMCSCPSMDQFK
ncbi:MAG: glycine dehydrogenase [Alphaproteobacteria bacterium]|jgi:glycine dehydrogenase